MPHSHIYHRYRSTQTAVFLTADLGGEETEEQDLTSSVNRLDEMGQIQMGHLFHGSDSQNGQLDGISHHLTQR